MCSLILSQLYNGFAGGLTITFSLLIFTTVFMLLSHLHNAEIYVSAKQNTCGFISIICGFVLCFNSGLLICSSRCLVKKDFPGIKHYINMHSRFLWIGICGFTIITIVYTFLCTYIYHGEI